MNKIVKVAALSLFTFTATNALAISDTFTASLEVKQALSISKVKDLDFGIVTSDHNADIVVAKNAAGAATFNINGADGDTVTIAISDTNLDNGGDLIATTFDFSPTLPLTGGSATLEIGGTARVAGQTLVAGTYTANVSVDVTYQ